MPTQAKEIFEAQSRSLRELFSDNGLGLYLPPYQRPYSWTKDQVGRLLDDTLHGLSNLRSAHDSYTFLGTVITIHDVNHSTVHPIVKPEVPSKVLTIIDGQQRISSLLLVLVVLHNQIRQAAWRVYKGKSPDLDDAAAVALYSEAQSSLQMLATAFYEKKNFGDAPIYPRLIRAFSDQWSKDARHKQYVSPIAHLVYNYAVDVDTHPGAQKPVDYRPKAREGHGEGEVDLLKRFNETRGTVDKLAKNKPLEEFEALPELKHLAAGIDFQRALFNHELDSTLCSKLAQDISEPEAELMRLVMLSAYVMNRIALTVVQGKDEDYAFTIFESLNTTGEPLTAFETFVPRVVSARGIDEYRGSDSFHKIASVQRYLDRFSVGPRMQTATQEMLVSFALAETGAKLSKRLADQRAYMRETFEQTAADGNDNEHFLLHLKNTAGFLGGAWESSQSGVFLPEVDSQLISDQTKLCLAFLKDLNHSIAIAPLVRFYSHILSSDGEEARAGAAKEFEEAVKAVTAFTVFWRMTRRGTGNIDSQYRAVMTGEGVLTSLPPVARQSIKGKKLTGSPKPLAGLLKKELAARLSDPKLGGIANLRSFISASSKLPLYKISKPLTRFALLAAYDNTIPDSNNPGMIVRGKEDVAQCFTAAGWINQSYLTIEHIAPQNSGSGWDSSLYVDTEVVHILGNLVLSPLQENSSLNARPWEQKRTLYKALGASSQQEARSVLDSSGIDFSVPTQEIVNMSHHLPHLTALSEREGAWDASFVESRSESLLRLVYARLQTWLDLDWSDSTEDEVVAVPQDDDFIEGD